MKGKKMDYKFDSREGFSNEENEAYDMLRDTWELGDEPITKRQRQENDDWERECRQNGW